MIHVNGKSPRQGRVLEQVGTGSMAGYDGQPMETYRKYRVHFPASGEMPEHMDVYREDELRVIPRDSRSS